MQNSEIRIPPLSPSEFTAEQKEVVGAWDVLNFSRVLAHHPSLYRAYVPFIEKVIRFTHLTPHDREILAIRTLAVCRDSYESSHHVDIARNCGMTDAQIEAAKAGTGAALSEFDHHLVKAADELVLRHRISDATWSALAQRYSTIELMEVVGLVGCYTTLAMITRTFGIPLESPGQAAESLETLRDYT